MIIDVKTKTISFCKTMTNHKTFLKTSVEYNNDLNLVKCDTMLNSMHFFAIVERFPLRIYEQIILANLVDSNHVTTPTEQVIGIRHF